MPRTPEVWGATVMSRAAATALGDERHHTQVRAFVLATSRAAAGRAFAAAGFFPDAAAGSRYIATWGGTSGNKEEIQTAPVEGQVWVKSINRFQSPALPWPPSQP